MFECKPFVFYRENVKVHHFELLQQDAFVSYSGHLGGKLASNYGMRVLNLGSFQKRFYQKNVYRFFGEFTSEFNPLKKVSDRMIFEPRKLELLCFGRLMEF